MATTKILKVRHRLDDTLDYTKNKMKTAKGAPVMDEPDALGAAIDYALNANKTETDCYVSAFNCEAATAYDDMIATKERWGKTRPGLVRGYHIIQSFHPDEPVTPAMVHEIGRQFAQRLLADKYEVVVSTHLDQLHLHNHIVFNATSFVDGRQYRNDFGDYYGGIREVSDDLCREHGLSVIDFPDGKGKSMAEVVAARQGAPTVRDIIRADIDRYMEVCIAMDDLLLTLRAEGGYTIKAGVQHIAVMPPGSKRYIRLDSLGPGYTQENLIERFAGVWERELDELDEYQPVELPRRYYLRGSHRPYRKVTGFEAGVYRYMYMLGKARRTGQAAFLLHSDVSKFHAYQRQYSYLLRNRLKSVEDVQAQRDKLAHSVVELRAWRKPLYRQRDRLEEGSPEWREANESIEMITGMLKVTYRELRLCDGILETSERISHVPERIQEPQQVKEKEREQDEPSK